MIRTRDEIAALVIATLGHYAKVPVTLASHCYGDLRLHPIDKVQAELDLEDHLGIELPANLEWGAVSELVDMVALEVFPGESGEVVGHAAWADDTLAACAEAKRPRAARDVPPGQSWAFTNHRTMAEVSRQELEMSRAACTDGIPKPEVIYQDVPAHLPIKIKREEG